MKFNPERLEHYVALLRARHTSTKRRFLLCGGFFLFCFFANWILNPGHWPIYIFFPLGLAIALAIYALWLEGTLEFVDVLRRSISEIALTS